MSTSNTGTSNTGTSNTGTSNTGTSKSNPVSPQPAAGESPGRVPLPPLRNTLTHDNLKKVLDADARATALYAYFGQIAEIEGFPEIATLFRDLSEGQALIVGGHVDLLMAAGDPSTGGNLGETRENLSAALAGATTDATDTLPAMARTAHAEGFPDIASWFESVAHAREAQAAKMGAGKGLLG